MNTENRWLEQEEIETDATSKEIRTALVNYERNKDWLEETIYEKVEDLALYACLKNSNDESVPVTKESAEYCSLTHKQIMSAAKSNTANQYQFANMGQVLRELCGITEADGDMVEALDSTPLWILSTRDQFYGAAMMGDMGILQIVHKALGEDFFILPSSIYEVLVLPQSNAGHGDICGNDLRNMVQQVNQEEVKEADQLSDNVYFFDGEKLTIVN